ncbi:hypothetical protein AN958_02304 [Leucoagaricus sp. SymC.cos]|nr:hypothetical protein AN958_02304 [Leucoagaricus sp. SymC.cos]
MQDLDSTENVITIIPQDEAVILKVNTYFSSTASIKGEALNADKYRSSQLNILGTQKPPNAPEDFPNYSTFIIFVEDSPPASQIAGAPEYDDSLITINILQGEALLPPPDTDPKQLGPTIDPGTLIPPPSHPPKPQLPVCIIGAGVSGLYTAMMLDSLGIKYEILEGSSRTGGRLYTHNFPKNAGKYQYFDVGAMHFPENTFMTCTFELATKCLGITMLGYVHDNDNTFLSYNKTSITRAKNGQKNPVKEDFFKVSISNDGFVPNDYFQKGSGFLWDHQILGELRQYFVNYSFPVAFDKLKQLEDHPVASYLLLVKKIPYSVVTWWETMEARTGLFDQSLLETVLHSLVFKDPNKTGKTFKTAWWEKLGIVGGQSSTDCPIRDVVYTLYGPDDSHPSSKKSNCMIASYNGSQDAQRLGGLMKGRDMPEERVMLDLIMRDLTAVHQVSIEQLWDEFEDYHPWDFYRDEFQLGAFCHFGPNQFKYTYPYVTQPASKNQHFHFASDVTSTFHGWVAGVLNSAWRAVLGMLLAHLELNPNPNEDIIAKFKKEWGDSEEWDQRTLVKHTYLGHELTKLNLQAP